VEVHIVHTYIGDLIVNLVAPDGSLYLLHNQTGGSADNINQTYTVNLSSEVANGTWRLRVQDAASLDTGYIDSWTLNLVGGGGGSDVFFDNFESATGWTTNPNGTDNATSGAWERGDPAQTSSGGVKQLGTTVSGVNDLVTGRLAGSSAGVYDIDGGTTSIQSGLITLPSSGTLTLTFSYYLAHGSNSSSADFFRAFVVTGSSTQVFQSLGAASNRNGVWTASGSISLSGFAGQTIRIRFEAADASTASLVEAGVDDVRITQS
jgi:subtilisin-like proprotein convertase family protein